MAIAARQLQTEGFTVEDVLAMPEDGLRYELFDGMLIVNPPPIVVHQAVVMRLMRLLAVPEATTFYVLPSPIGWRPASGQRWFEPDLVVVDLPDGPGDREYLTDPPALVVEVLSPRTHTYDQTLKREAYDEGGVGAYWIVDPSAAEPSAEPSVVVLERVDAGEPLVEVSRAVGTEVARATRPWPVDIVPADLIR